MGDYDNSGSSRLEDNIDDYIYEKFGEEIEEKISSLNFDGMVFLSLVWTGSIGFILMLVFGSMLWKGYQKLDHPVAYGVVLENISKKDESGLSYWHHPKVEYEVDGKKYVKVMARGWGSPWFKGDKFSVGYVEGLPETAESPLYPGLRTRVSNLETVFVISLCLFIFPFIMRWIMKNSSRKKKKEELMEEYREIARNHLK